MTNTNTCEFQCWHILGHMRAVLVSRTFVGATEITVGVKRAPSIRYVMRHVIHVCNVIAATCKDYHHATSQCSSIWFRASLYAGL